MRLLICISFLTIFFQACSFKSPENKWEYNSASSFASFTKNFLTDNEELAIDDLERSVKYAKQSADLKQLARIYLGECALNISVGIKDTCVKYKSLEGLVESKELNAYLKMLEELLTKEQVSNLPKQYQQFSEYKYEKKYDLAFDEIKNMNQESSQFIAASLIKNKINKSQINYLITRASFYGYKKIVLFWLEHLKNIEDDTNEKKKLEKKIYILKN